MDFNPRDYDPDELRDGGELDVQIGGDGASFRAEDVLRSGQHRELMVLDEMRDGELERPYLSRVPDSFAAEVIAFEWLEYLVAKAGLRGATDALGYYERLDWITDGAEATLRDYMRGIDAATEEGTLDMQDHVRSLTYIAQLSAMA